MKIVRLANLPLYGRVFLLGGGGGGEGDSWNSKRSSKGNTSPEMFVQNNCLEIEFGGSWYM